MTDLFPVPVSGGDVTRLRRSNYWQRCFTAISTNEVLFRAQVNGEQTEPFLSFAFDNVSIGSYTDCLPGLTCYLSPTTDIRDAIYRGRVRLAPTASTFYIDYNATAVPDNSYIIVTADSDVFARVRQGDLADGSISFYNLPPMIDGLPGCLVLYDSTNAGYVDYTPSQDGVPVADGATINDSTGWQWAIRGGGATSYQSGSSTSKAPTIRFTAGFKYMLQCSVTDSNAVTHYQWVHVYAIDRVFSAPVVLPVVTGSIESDLENGFSASITAYAQVNTLADRSHVAVFVVEHFGDDTSAPVLSNLRFSGRLRGETITTEGSAEAGQVQQVTFSAEGITAIMQRLRVPNDIVRHNATPDAFGEIKNPTVYRMAVYALDLYSTVLTQGSFTAGQSSTLAWKIGGEPVSIDGGTALDMLAGICERIKAAPNYAPDGSIHLEQLASYQVDRSGIVTIADLEPMRESTGFEIDRDTSRQTGQVTAYGGYWSTVNNTFVLLTAFAPTVPYSESPETRELTRELLETDSTATEAETELQARAGNELAYYNAKPLITLDLIDSMNFLFATGYQRYTALIPATSNSRGIAYGTSDYWQLQRVTTTYNPDGTAPVNAELVAETSNTDAQSVASLLPDNLTGMNPVFPVLSNDPAFPDDPLWMFPTDTPTLEEYPPIDPYSDFLANSPFTPDQAADAARKQGTANCKTVQVNMRNPGTTLGDFLTVNGAGYTVKITGTGQIGSDSWTQTFNMTSGLNGWTFALDNLGNPIGAVSPGSGITTTDCILEPSNYQLRGLFIAYNVVIPSLTSISIVMDFTAGGLLPNSVFWLDGSPLNLIPSPPTNGTNVVTVYAPGGSIAAASQIGIQVNSSYQTAYSGAALLKSITLTGTGTNPFTSDPGGDSFGDAFYRYFPGDDGSAALFGTTEGLLFAGNKPAVIPPYSPNHEYTVQITGDGNQPQLAYALADYTEVVNRLLTLTYCRNP